MKFGTMIQCVPTLREAYGLEMSRDISGTIHRWRKLTTRPVLFGFDIRAVIPFAWEYWIQARSIFPGSLKFNASVALCMKSDGPIPNRLSVWASEALFVLCGCGTCIHLAPYTCGESREPWQEHVSEGGRSRTSSAAIFSVFALA